MDRVKYEVANNVHLVAGNLEVPARDGHSQAQDRQPASRAKCISLVNRSRLFEEL